MEIVHCILQYFKDHMSLIVASCALILSYVGIRFHVKSLIVAQLTEKAKICNSNINPESQRHFPVETDKVSSILSSIVTAEELLYYQLKKRNRLFTILFVEQSIIDQFYLQLHTTIRNRFKKEKPLFLKNENLDPADRAVLTDQFERAKSFINVSIEKDKKGRFAKLQKYSNRRNIYWRIKQAFRRK